MTSPIRMVNGQMVFIRDVAHVRQGAGVQTNIVRINGRRAAYLEVLKFGAASTIARRQPNPRAAAPGAGRHHRLTSTSTSLQDQSHIRPRRDPRASSREGVIAACLTAFMILLFLGSWRSTIIVAISIPLSILTSVVVLWALGQTINIQSLGGLALAVGILVDDATVEIENVHRNMAQGKTLLQAIIDGASQVAVARHCRVAVDLRRVRSDFLPERRVGGAVSSARDGRDLRDPRVLPSVANARPDHGALHAGRRTRDVSRERGGADRASPPGGPGFGASTQWSSAASNGFARAIASFLDLALDHKAVTLGLGFAFIAASMLLVPAIGEDFFPTVDAGVFQLHVRAPAGTRLEENELIFGEHRADDPASNRSR